MTAFTILYALLKKELSVCEPVSYWAWYMSPVIVLGACMALTGLLLNKRHLARVAAGYKYLESDMQWTPKVLKAFPLVSLMAGVAAGLLGIGGGMIIGPLFMQVGLEPKVGTASCAFMILWTATSGVVQYMALGKLGWEFMGCCVAVGFVSGQIGQRGVNYVLEKSGRPSLVILLLGGVIAVACSAMTIGGGVRVASQALSGEDIFVFSTEGLLCDQ